MALWNAIASTTYNDVRALRARALTQVAIARRLHISQASVSIILHCSTLPQFLRPLPLRSSCCQVAYRYAVEPLGFGRLLPICPRCERIA